MWRCTNADSESARVEAESKREDIVLLLLISVTVLNSNLYYLLFTIIVIISIKKKKKYYVKTEYYSNRLELIDETPSPYRQIKLIVNAAKPRRNPQTIYWTLALVWL